MQSWSGIKLLVCARNHTPAFSKVQSQNQTLLIFISSGVSHVQWCYSAHNKAYKVIVYLLKRGV